MSLLHEKQGDHCNHLLIVGGHKNVISKTNNSHKHAQTTACIYTVWVYTTISLVQLTYFSFQMQQGLVKVW